MLWVKSLHIVFMVTWFAGLFYLPRLFVYHAMADDAPSRERFKVMERKLYWGIMTPGGVLTILFGLWLWFAWGFTGGWLHAKVALTALLVVIYSWVYRSTALTHWTASSPWTWITALLLVDFCYYWFHRASHRVNFIWATHIVHHQSEELNLAVALRQWPGVDKGARPLCFKQRAHVA